MKAFQYFVHTTAGLIKNINSAPLNLPIGGFYSLDSAKAFANTLDDKLNFVVIYDVSGNIHTVMQRHCTVMERK